MKILIRNPKKMSLTFNTLKGQSYDPSNKLSTRILTYKPANFIGFNAGIRIVLVNKFTRKKRKHGRAICP